jgi:hypothetical protein
MGNRGNPAFEWTVKDCEPIQVLILFRGSTSTILLYFIVRHYFSKMIKTRKVCFMITEKSSDNELNNKIE